MGYYINQDQYGNNLPTFGKVAALVAAGATTIESPTCFQQNLVCVVEYNTHEAAAYLYSADEMEYFKKNTNYKTFLIVPNAKELAE